MATQQPSIMEKAKAAAAGAAPQGQDAAAEGQPQQAGPVDIESIVQRVQVPPNLKGIYDKAVLSGMRIMFDKASHTMFEQQMEKPQPLPQKMAEGITTLIYMLWNQSNKTLPPQIIAPVTVTLTLRAFEFLQKSGDPEATPAMLGEALDATIDMVMGKFGVRREQLAQMVGQQPGAAQPQAGAEPQPQQPGAAQ